MTKKVLVTGGAGFIGAHLVRALVDRGYGVRVLDNFSSGRRENLDGLPVEIIVGDVTEAATVRRAMETMTHVIHLAALPSVARSLSDPLLTHRVNVTGTLEVLVAARACGVQRLVFASSSSVYGDAGSGPRREDWPPAPLSPYGVSKLAAEKYCLAFYAAYGLETTALRYFNVFGPRQDPHSEYAAVIPKFITAWLSGRRPVIYGDGEQTRDFTYVDNVVQGTLLALEGEEAVGQVFNLAMGRQTSLNQLAQLLREIIGVRSNELMPEHSAPRPADIRHSTADISRARAVLGYAPDVDLRRGLELTVEWYRHNSSRTE